MMKKMTKREVLEQMLTHLTDPVEVEFVEHELELLARRAGKDKGKASPKQIENEALRAAILDAMEPGVKYTVDGTKDLVPELAEATPQRVTALLTPMVKDGRVVKTMEKRKAYFEKA